MPIKPIQELFASARAGGYALGYFESWNLESLQGAIDAAEKTRSPIIIGFNGEFLTRPERIASERIVWYAALARAAAETAAVPCSIFFNECPSEEYTRQAVTAGFNMVMYANPGLSFEDYTLRVTQLTRWTHPHGVAVEAEIDELPSGSTGVLVAGHSSLTDPELAARFIAATGIDLLSISVGNVHVLVGQEKDLDLIRLEEIRKRVNIPLGLHGGSGIPAASLRAAIQLGVTKVAYGTYLKQRYLAAQRKALGTDEINPHKLLGMGEAEDVMVAGRLAVRDAILERIEHLGCCGRA
jgi:ketose-bisphosphate aldolase